MSRPTFTDTFFEIARTVAKRSTCDRANVGAVLVDEHNRIIATGYNGSPTNLPHCDDDAGHLLEDGHCIRTIHAEVNALVNATVSTRGAKLYVTHFPCIRCANLLIQAGITYVRYLQEYGDCSRSKMLFYKAGVTVNQHIAVTTTENPTPPPLSPWWVEQVRDHPEKLHFAAKLHTFFGADAPQVWRTRDVAFDPEEQVVTVEARIGAAGYAREIILAKSHPDYLRIEQSYEGDSTFLDFVYLVPGNCGLHALYDDYVEAFKEALNSESAD